jgi:hypothetical protein
MKKPKEFVSNKREEIEAELLRLMRDPKCYAISTIEISRSKIDRMRIIERVGENRWLSNFCFGYWNLSRRSCFSPRPKHFRTIAHKAAIHSEDESTLIVGWFA